MFNEIAPMLRETPHLPTGDIATIYDRNAERVMSGEQLLDLAVEVLSFDQVAAAAWIARASEILLPERRANATKKTGSGLAPWQVNKVIAYVNDKLDSTIRTDDCARIARLSTSQFSRAFKVSFKQTLVHYIIQRRTEHAQELMMRTDEPLCQIALNCGFADQSHLSRLFRRVVGVSPATWRRHHRVMAA